jgi:beta-phosphoglucomutase-like phosphatase (HAD superfamily)
MMPTLRCRRETLQIFGYDLSLAEFHQLSGMDGAEMLEKLLPDAAKTTRQEMLDLQGKRFREDFLTHVPAFPGVRALFKELKRRKRKVALATDCRRASSRTRSARKDSTSMPSVSRRCRSSPDAFGSS